MKDNKAIIAQEGLKVICGVSIYSLISFEFSIKPNINAEAKIKVLLSDVEETTDNILEFLNWKPIKIVETANDGTENYPPLFAGIIINCEINHEGGSREANILAASGSFQLDIMKKSRSFQNTEMSYREVIDDLLKSTEKASFLYFADEKKLDKPVIQYQETDFSFAVRIASHQNTCIYPDIAEPAPRIYYGLRKGEDRGELSVNNYQMGMESYFNKKTSKKDALLFYEITCGEDYNIGDCVLFNRTKLRVCTKKGTLEKGLLYFTYILAKEAWTWHSKIYNTLFPGVSIEATVLKCQQEYIKLHLAIDPVQDEKEAYFFLWKPNTGNLMYCMPDVGTKVYLNVAGRDEGDAHAVSCIRLNGNVCQETQSPDKRFLSTEHGKKLGIHPELLEFRGDTKDGTTSSMSLEDKNGIEFQTNQKLTIHAKEGVRIKGARVRLTTLQEFTVVKKDLISPTVMNLNYTIDILGGKGKITSEGGKLLQPLTDRKRREEYDITDITEKVLSSIPQGEDESEISSILSASFLSTLYSRK